MKLTLKNLFENLAKYHTFVQNAIGLKCFDCGNNFQKVLVQKRILVKNRNFVKF